VEPVPPEALARFVPDWQGVGARSHGVDAVLRAVEQRAGMPLPASALETLILPSRVSDYSPAMLDELTLAGDVVWSGAGALGGNDGWVALAPAEIASFVLPEPDGPDDDLALAVLATLGHDEAVFFRALVDRVNATRHADAGTEHTPETPDAVGRAVWDLVWAGALTNDTIGPVRALLGSAGRTAHASKPRAPRSRYARYGRPRGPSLTGGLPLPSAAAPGGVPTGMGGRWSAVQARTEDATRRALVTADVLLDRYGLVTRGSVVAERVSGGFAAVYPVFKTAEESGRARRGYFVEGLGAAQFALPGAVDRLRAEARPLDSRAPEGSSALVLAATDPANPYGAALEWPQAPRPADGGRGHQAARKAGALVVLIDGDCVLYVERGGRTLLSFAEEPAVLQAAADALALAVRDGALGRLQVERADGAPVAASALGDALEAAGFRPTPRGLRLRA
jgi:ATP-dependent Lhr-like helicase